MKNLFLLLLLILTLSACSSEAEQAAASQLLAIGTYTKKEGHVDGKAPGILLMRQDSLTGALEMIDTIPEIINPSFVAFAPDGQHLYAVSETAADVDSVGYVYSYALGKDGSATLLNRQSTYGLAPCHLAVHPEGNWLSVANYVGGYVAVYPLAADGRIQEAAQAYQIEEAGSHPRQEASHPHEVKWLEQGTTLMITDLGANRVVRFAFSAADDEPLQRQRPDVVLPPDRGPRHTAVSQNAQHWYVLNELSNTVAFFAERSDSISLQEEYNLLPASFEGTSGAAEITLSKDGRHLYASNRGYDSVVHFSVQSDGTLSEPVFYESKGEAPRHFCLSPDQRFLYIANQNSDSVVRYVRDVETGALSEPESWAVPTPVCLAFQP